MLTRKDITENHNKRHIINCTLSSLLCPLFTREGGHESSANPSIAEGQCPQTDARNILRVQQVLRLNVLVATTLLVSCNASVPLHITHELCSHAGVYDHGCANRRSPDFFVCIVGTPQSEAGQSEAWKCDDLKSSRRVRRVRRFREWGGGENRPFLGIHFTKNEREDQFIKQ